MKTEDFEYVCTYVREQAAIVLEPGKEYLVESRLDALARKKKFESVDALVAHLKRHPNSEMHRSVVDAMTTNETSFFRDLHPFEALRKVILPELLEKRRADKQLNFWCGAASTGQECFSVLMTIAEHCPELLQWNLNFIATDLCREVLSRAQAGRFNQLEVNRGLPAALLVKHFERHGDEWEFSDALRKKVQFREMNLLDHWPLFPGTDVVFLRNVLIYFDVPTKKAILSKTRRLLRPGGYLFLGGAETTMNLCEQFDRVVIEKATCYRAVD